MAQEPERRDGRFRREISEKELQRWHRMFYQSGLSLDEVGRLVEVNPRHLSRCFPPRRAAGVAGGGSAVSGDREAGRFCRSLFSLTADRRLVTLCARMDAHDRK